MIYFSSFHRRRPWVDKYGPPTRTNYRVIVENLSSRVSWQDLKDLMRRVADVSYANAHNDRRNEGYDLQSLSDSFLRPPYLTPCSFEAL